MKLNMIGNTCNNHYTIAKNLRRLGVDVHLFFDGRLDAQTFPESDDIHLCNEYPDWLHRYGAKEVGRAPFVGVTPEFHAQLSDCDLLHVEDCGVIWAAQTGRPFVWDPYGYDLNHYPFYKSWHIRHAVTFKKNPELILAAYRFRRAMERANSIIYAIWYKDLSHGFDLINQLCTRTNFIHDIPMSYDIDLFSPSECSNIKQLLKEYEISLPNDTPVIFHPTRVMFTQKAHISKGNDKLLHAIKKLKDEGIEYLLVMIEKGNQCEHAARELIQQLRITDNVVWIPKMPRHQLATWYRSANIVADDFSGGAPGSVVFEGMACGRPVITYFQLESQESSFWPISEVYPELPPIVNVHTEDDIVLALKKLHNRPAEREEIGKASRIWMERYASGEVIARKFLQHYEWVLKTRTDRPPTRANTSKKKPISTLDTLIQTQDENNILETILHHLDHVSDDISNQSTLIEYYRKFGSPFNAITLAIQALQIEPRNDKIRANFTQIITETLDHLISNKLYADVPNILNFASNIVGFNADLEARRHIASFASGNITQTMGSIQKIKNTNGESIIIKAIDIMSKQLSPKLALNFAALATTAGIKSPEIHDAIRRLGKIKM